MFRTFSTPGCVDFSELSTEISCSGPNSSGLYRINWVTSHSGRVETKVGTSTVNRLVGPGAGGMDWSPYGNEGRLVRFTVTVTALNNTTSSVCTIDVPDCEDPTIELTGSSFDADELTAMWESYSTNVGHDIASHLVVVKVDDVTIETSDEPGIETAYTSIPLTAYPGQTATIDITAYDSCGGSATTQLSYAIPDEDFAAPSLSLGACGVASGIGTVDFTATVPHSGSNLTAVITNNVSLPTQSGIAVTSGVEQAATLDVSTLEPGRPFSMTVTVTDDADGKSAGLTRQCQVPCASPTVSGLSAEIESDILTVDYTAATPNYNANLTVTMQLKTAAGVDVGVPVTGTSTEASKSVAGFAAGDYKAVITVADDCGILTASDEIEFDICVCPADDPITITLEWDDWDTVVDGLDGSDEIVTATVALSNISGWPTGVSVYDLISYDGQVDPGVTIDEDNLTFVILREEACLVRNAEVEATPGAVCNCDPIPITLELSADEENGFGCELLDESVECADNPDSLLLVDTIGSECLDCPAGQYSANNEYDTSLDPLLDGWFDEVNTGQPIMFQGSGNADSYTRVTTFAAGRVEEHLTLVSISGTLVYQFMARLFNTSNEVVHRIVGQQSETINENTINCEEAIVIDLVSDPGTTVPLGDLSVTITHVDPEA